MKMTIIRKKSLILLIILFNLTFITAQIEINDNDPSINGVLINPSGDVIVFDNNTVSVNVSDWWDDKDTHNSTQMETSGGVLNILESWIKELFSSGENIAAVDIYVNETGDTMTGDLNMSNNSITDVDTLYVHNITGRSPIIFGSEIDMSGFNVTNANFYLGSGKFLTDINTTGFGRIGASPYLYNDTLSIYLNESYLNLSMAQASEVQAYNDTIEIVVSGGTGSGQSNDFIDFEITQISVMGTGNFRFEAIEASTGNMIDKDRKVHNNEWIIVKSHTITNDKVNYTLSSATDGTYTVELDYIDNFKP